MYLLENQFVFLTIVLAGLQISLASTEKLPFSEKCVLGWIFLFDIAKDSQLCSVY